LEIRARHRAVDGHGPEPAHILGTAAGLVDTTNIPLAAADDVVRAVLVDPGAKVGWADEIKSNVRSWSVQEGRDITAAACLAVEY
jgi:hypothetical protein